MKLLTKFICLSALLLLASCSDNPEPVLRLGTNVWPGYEPLYLARQRGALKEDKVHLVEFSSASQVIQAYRNNLIDAAALTLDEVLLLLESGEKLKIVLVMDISNGGDAIVGQPDITTLTDISGKRVGLDNSALGAYVITRALEIANLNRKSIEIIPIDINEQEKAFLQHKVDAVVTFEPVRSKLLTSGGRLLFDSRQLPGEIVDVLIIRDEYLNRYPTSVQYVLNGWYQALAFMKQQPREAAKILGLRMKLGVDETLAAYEGLKLPDPKENQQLLKQQPEPQLLLSANKLMQLMYKQGLLKDNVDPSLLFSDSGLQHHLPHQEQR
jgi:NitT/TauT family transport system substrate-binding protein